MEHRVEEIQLASGARGLLVDAPSAPVLYMMFSFRAGDYLSPSGKWDTAHLLEHMMLGANGKFARARDFQAELQKNGAFYNAYTSSHDITYVSECADFEWRRVFDLVIQALENPLFKDEEYQAESGNVREELSGDLNEHLRQLIISSRQAHGLATLPDGQRLAQLKNITLQDVKSHYEKTHTLGNLRFVIAGKLAGRRQNIVKRLEKLQLNSGKRRLLPDETPHKLKNVLYIDHLGVENLHFVINFFDDATIGHTEENSLSLLNTMMTSTLHSGILGEAREKGLAYHIMSSYSRGRNNTSWWFGAQLLSGNAGPVFEIISKHLKKVLDGEITNNDLGSAKKYALGKFKRSAQTVGALARHYGQGYFFDEHIEYFNDVEPNIRIVTKDELAEVARKMVNKKLWGVGVLSSDSQGLARTLKKQIEVLWP